MQERGFTVALDLFNCNFYCDVLTFDFRGTEVITALRGHGARRVLASGVKRSEPVLRLFPDPVTPCFFLTVAV